MLRDEMMTKRDAYISEELLRDESGGIDCLDPNMD